MPHRKGPTEDYGEVLVRAILKLPARLRDVFLLHRMAGMTYIEIGLHLGMTPETVQASLAAALVRLMRAVPTSAPFSGKSDGEVTRIVASSSQRKACHAAATHLDRHAAYDNSGEKSRRIMSDQTLSKVS